MRKIFLIAFVTSGIMSLGLLKAHAQVITIDNYYNQEKKKDSLGNLKSFHYLWDDKEMTGFSIFGRVFKKNGAEYLNILKEKPTLKNLANSDVYIIVDPDNLKDNPNPNFMNEKDASAISKWVKAGGVLLLLANDEANADLKSFNILAEKFGFSFSGDLILHVTSGRHLEDGGLNTGDNLILKNSKRIYIKDASSITIKHTAKPILQTLKGENIIVMSKYGKGTVVAVGDPWLYNEYTNGGLPAEFQNETAANDMAKFLIGSIRKRKVTEGK